MNGLMKPVTFIYIFFRLTQPSFASLICWMRERSQCNPPAGGGEGSPLPQAILWHCSFLGASILHLVDGRAPLKVLSDVALVHADRGIPRVCAPSARRELPVDASSPTASSRALLGCTPACALRIAPRGMSVSSSSTRHKPSYRVSMARPLRSNGPMRPRKSSVACSPPNSRARLQNDPRRFDSATRRDD